MPCLACPPAARQGYTLVELMIVIALLSILTSMVLPQFQPSVHEQITAVAQIVADDLAYCRTLAVMNSSEYSLAFDQATNSYTLTHAGSNPQLRILPSGPFGRETNPSHQRIAQLDDLPSLGPRVVIVGIETEGSPVAASGSLTFGPLGSVSGGRDITIWLSAGAGSARRYIPLIIPDVSGLIEIGDTQKQAP
ncbi:putative major pilin subunit [Lignipirellula cremea]|uniref:Putative major pilin subunit n=2 Tax=Lignipirellula cremea TaxID=2528010 RepID=A0A518DSE7_9BACT|nr:putative major pilin subunit [Lignipirellula cremea]